MGRGGILGVALRRDELHRKIGDGIPKGSLMFIEGEDGAGKSIIVQRLMYGFLKNDCSVTYICTEMTTDDFLSQMSSLEYDVGTFLLNGRLLAIPVFPRIGKVTPRTDFLDRLLKAKPLYQNDVIIMDTLNTMVIGKFSKADSFKMVSFLKKLIGIDKTMIITANPALIDEDMLNLLRSISDIHFKVAIKLVEGETKRLIIVNRFKGAQIQMSGALGFRVEPKVGFVIEIASVA